MDRPRSVALTLAPSFSTNTIPTSPISVEKNIIPIVSSLVIQSRHPTPCSRSRPRSLAPYLHSRPSTSRSHSSPPNSSSHLHSRHTGPGSQPNTFSKKTEKASNLETVKSQKLHKDRDCSSVSRKRLPGSHSTPNLVQTASSRSPNSIPKTYRTDVVPSHKPNPIQVVKVITRLQEETACGMKMIPVKFTLEPSVSRKMPIVRGVSLNKAARLRIEANHRKLNGWGKMKPKVNCGFSCFTVDKY